MAKVETIGVGGGRIGGGGGDGGAGEPAEGRRSGRGLERKREKRTV